MRPSETPTCPIRILDPLPASKIKFSPPADPAGRVPAGAGTTTPLTIGKASLNEITLSWDHSCRPSDSNYTVYEGLLGDFTSHEPRFCTTMGATTKTFAPATASRYYLVVPRTANREGSYGTDHFGLERPGSSSACLPPGIAACE